MKTTQGKITYIDLEPKWVDLVNFWVDTREVKCSDFIHKELLKMARATDILRQAQKKKKKWLRIGD
jgi:hypothetical protein